MSTAEIQSMSQILSMEASGSVAWNVHAEIQTSDAVKFKMRF
jgi:hypothetical protein